MQVLEKFSKWKNLILFALGIAILILGTVTVFRAALFDVSRTDLTVYLRAAEAIHNHESIYAVENMRHWHYVYLPLLAVLLTPFTALPLWLNAALWYLLSMTALIGTCLGVSSLFKNKKQSFWLVLVCIIVALPPLLNTFTRGQIGAISLYLTLLPFLLDSKGKKWTAGFVLGFAIVLKMSPLLILPFYFVLQRNWRAVLGCFLSGVFFSLIFPSLVLGTKLNWSYLLNYFHVLSEGSGPLAWKSYLWSELFTPFAGDNQSFYAIATRLFLKTEAAFIEHSNALIRLANFGFLISLLTAVVVLFVRHHESRFTLHASRESKTKNDFIIFSLLSCVMLFTSPVTQPHHYTPLLLLAAAGFALIENHSSHKKIIFPAMGICLLFFALGMLIEPLAEIGSPFLGSLLLWLTIWIIQFKKV